MKKLLLVIGLLTLVSCTNESDATRALKMSGYTDIEFTGYRWFGCSRGDFYHTGFKAKINGNEAEGVVCSGLFFKAATVRF